ncbi:unnamed protein product [Blepharisma stoltei]|uniref:F-box domain-containing protein n=1 Tax=Blepharisma stoltei TaxID=1481888 RepID=A0AAU9JDN6_9CILI|nr:unnamed protein product [Blepharisma stoltei]
MISLNLIQDICEYLTYKELTCLAQACKKYQRIVYSSKLFKKEAIRLFMGNLDLYQTYDEYTLYPKLVKQENDSSSLQWKSLLDSHFEIKIGWKQLAGRVLNKNDIEQLYCILLEEFKNPAIPIPRLKAEYFSSNYQDLIVIGDSIFLDSYKENQNSNSIMQALNSQDFLEEFSSDSQIQMLNYAIQYFWSPSFDSTNSPWILKFYSLIYQMISINCKFAYSRIKCYSGEDLLDEYTIIWSAFSAAMQNLADFLDPLVQSLNNIRNSIYKTKPKFFKLYNLMNKIWKEEVFKKLEEEITENIIFLWRRIRSSDNDSGINLLIKSIEFIVDHSVDEESLLYKNHTKLFTAEPYKHINENIMEETKIYYQKLETTIENLQSIIDRDIRILKLAFLPLTQKKFERLAYYKLQQAISSHLSKEISEFSISTTPYCNERLLNDYLYSPIGAFLFQQEMSVHKVKLFISYGLSKNTYLSFFKIYNNGPDKILEVYKAQDQEIEAKAKRCGFPFENLITGQTADSGNFSFENIAII